MTLILLGFASAGGAQVPPLLHGATGSAAREAPLDAVGHLRAIERRLAADPGSRQLRLQRVGALYLLAVEVEEAIEAGLGAVDRLRGEADPADAALQARLLGFEGAFTVLRAKHGFWPHHRLGNVQRGMDQLDRAVADAPDDPVIRYLRLMSGFYLPSFFGRKDEVRADFGALAKQMPAAHAEFPGSLHGVVVRFVLEHGQVDAAERRLLERSLGR